jgi:hypothetical protein
MGEGTPNVKDESPEELEQEVTEIRVGMNGLMRELDCRRHELFDWRMQLRKHALALSIGAVALACFVGGFTVVTALRKRRRQRLLATIEVSKDALSRMVAHPESVAPRQRNLGKTALSATAGALVGAAANSVAQRTIVP